MARVFRAMTGQAGNDLAIRHIDKNLSTASPFLSCKQPEPPPAAVEPLAACSALGDRIIGYRNDSKASPASKSQLLRFPEIRSFVELVFTPAV
jgi:hypothetical protein